MPPKSISVKTSIAEKKSKIKREIITVLDEVFQKVSLELQSSVIAGTEESLKSLMEPVFEELLFEETISKADFAEIVEEYLIGMLTELVQ